MMRNAKRKPKAPGKSFREGLTIVQLVEMFPNEETATKWFESEFWPEERCCGHCGSTKTRKASHKTMPYWCTDCRRYFSVRTGTILAHSKAPLKKWVIAIYLELTSLKGISSMKLHRDIGVTQSTAWFMLHRIREAWGGENGNGRYNGPVEVDEAYMGGKRKNMHAKKRKALTGRGASGKTAVVGMKDRESNQVSAKVVTNTKHATLRGFVAGRITPGAQVYTDDSGAYAPFPNHESVKHSVGEYVRGMAHTNGVESFWSLLKRAYTGTFHKMSPKHLNRYVQEFAGCHNLRRLDTLEQMSRVALGFVGKRLSYRMLIADNGLASGARGA